MFGKVGGVKAKIKEKYPKAAFVNCAAHRFNLVVNDLNYVAMTIIKFFQREPQKTQPGTKCPHLETRWTHKNLHQPLRRYIQTTTLYSYSFWQFQPRRTPVGMRIWNVDILGVPGYHGKTFSNVAASDTSFASCSI